jgi:excisionase family DNA binding protein
MMGTATATHALLSVEEAAEQLGVSVASVRAWVLRREIEYIKVRKSVRIRQSVIDNLIAAGTIAPRRSIKKGS